jgi:hypothetical protein
LWVSVQIALHGDLINKGRFTQCERPKHKSNKKDTMDTQQNPNEPGKPPSPGQQGGGQQDREREERERQRRERENKVAVNRAAVSKVDDKTGCSLGTSERREVTPAAFLF